ncbi:dihydrofolate reductase family protein [Methylocystis echinoides]|uniref:dihydrofolate reductase family protein n=1 Tax=Methylocystis echinoides TaxID=29468 RepID=UPI002492C49B|nr:dihydrofolate reductase family protein [Methylocystis echinoides]
MLPRLVPPSRGNQSLDWESSHRLGGIGDVAALKQSHGPDLIIQGSSTIYPALLAARLIDRLTLMTFPVTLGRGKRLFGDARRRARSRWSTERLRERDHDRRPAALSRPRARFQS